MSSGAGEERPLEGPARCGDHSSLTDALITDVPRENPVLASGSGRDGLDSDDGQWELLKALQIPGYARQQQRREKAARDVFTAVTVEEIQEVLDDLHQRRAAAHHDHDHDHDHDYSALHYEIVDDETPGVTGAMGVPSEELPSETPPINVIEYAPNGDIMACGSDEVEIEVAVDSAAVDNVINEGDLARGCRVEPNTTGHHFSGAGGEHIQRHGTCTTLLGTEHGEVSCDWQVADVTRPLNAVCKLTGPEEGDGIHDVMFSNKRCIVLPAGTVERLAKETKPIVQYPRKGNLYVAKMKLSSFARPGGK